MLQLQSSRFYGDQPLVLEIGLRLTSMPKGELVGIVVLALISTWLWCYLSYAYANSMMMCDECLVC